uniref:Uncharacterized protein n=1 Tax=Arundo donax TaxID=35708 RepID=A0A0A9H865_ARUDO
MDQDYKFRKKIHILVWPQVPWTTHVKKAYVFNANCLPCQVTKKSSQSISNGVC